MEDHLREILGLVVEQTINGGEPVGSQYLVDHYKLNLSPSTVRNYFMNLEEDEFIMQPHTSSGRLPTEKGYRYYVEFLLKPRNLSRKELNVLTEAVAGVQNEQRRMKQCAKAVSDLAQNAFVLGIGDMDSYYTGLSNLFTQPEFKDWNRIVSMSDVLDRLDEVLLTLRQSYFEEPVTLIGCDCPFGPMCGAVVMTAPGNGNLMAVLGPMRMDYGLTISLMNKTKQLLKG